MSKKNVILLVVVGVIIIAVAVWLFVDQPVVPGIPLGVEGPGGTEQREVTVGYGWSVNPNVKEAVQEAVSSVLKEFEDGSPEYAILFSTSKYDSQELINELGRLLPETKVQGGTVMLGMFTKDGYHIGENGSLSLLAISSDKIDIGVGGADVDALVSAQEAGKQAISAALRDVGREGEKPKMIYMVGSFANEQALIAGIEEVVGEDVPIVGGSAFDEEGVGDWRQFANDVVYINGVAVTAFFTDLTIAWAYEAGYEKTGIRGVITKCDGNIIYEIDNSPALEVYDEWSGGLVSRISAGSEEETIIEIEQTALMPFAKVMTGVHGAIDYVPMHPYLWNFTDKSIGTGVNVEVGDVVTVMHGTWEANLNHCQSTPVQALEDWNIEKEEAYFAIYNYCLGKMLTLPAEEREKIPLLLNNVLGGTPFIGGNTGGEQGYLEGIGNVHGALVNSIIIFGPEQ